MKTKQRKPKRGAPAGSQNGNSSLTEAQVSALRTAARKRSSFSADKWATKLGCSKRTIARVLRGETYPGVSPVRKVAVR